MNEDELLWFWYLTGGPVYTWEVKVIANIVVSFNVICTYEVKKRTET